MKVLGVRCVPWAARPLIPFCPGGAFAKHPRAKPAEVRDKGNRIREEANRVRDKPDGIRAEPYEFLEKAPDFLAPAIRPYFSGVAEMGILEIHGTTVPISGKNPPLSRISATFLRSCRNAGEKLRALPPVPAHS